ncbi:MAG: hypothetical protein WC260_02340 [Candidatus Pacearchaeota archaeon]
MRNVRVMINSILAIVCIVLTFLVHWSFIIISILLMILNQKLLFKKTKI